MEPGLLPRFFERVTRQTFLDLGLDDEPAARYLIDVLTRFARTDALYRIDLVPGRRLDTVVDSLLAIEGAWQIDSSATGFALGPATGFALGPATGFALGPDFAPEREQVLRQHVGDFTLFMAGVFRDHVERLGVLGLYETEGRRAYRLVAEVARAQDKPEAALFRRLSGDFERYTGALTFMRKVYFRDEALPFTELPGPRMPRRLAG